jgi:hypothetical protein
MALDGHLQPERAEGIFASRAAASRGPNWKTVQQELGR